MGIVWWLIVGLLAGWITGKVMGGPGKGVLMDIIVGLLGQRWEAGSSCVCSASGLKAGSSTPSSWR